MISLEEAIRIILNHAVILPSERVRFEEAHQRVLAEDVFSDLDMPPFDKSAMDGYACRAADKSQELTIVETINAGRTPRKALEAGQCSKIMTGAPVPEGADCVVMKEDVVVTDNKIRVKNISSGTNICYLGEDVKKGAILLSEGTRLKPQHIAVLAQAGTIMPMVYKKPQVTVITTGDEIVEPSLTPGESQIRNSNAYQLMAQMALSGAIPEYAGIVGDNLRELTGIISNHLHSSDIIILTGGASRGDFDLVPEALIQLGFEVHFREVAIQPGKPVCLATRFHQVCIGLSGNPVSSFCQFELLVKPFLKKISGEKSPLQEFQFEFDGTLEHRQNNRQYYFPVRISEDHKAIPVTYHGSAHIQALAGADGLASIKPGKGRLNKGEIVNVRLI